MPPDENSKNEKITNLIELPNPGLAKDLNKIEVTRMKDFETEVIIIIVVFVIITIITIIIVIIIVIITIIIVIIIIIIIIIII